MSAKRGTPQYFGIVFEAKVRAMVLMLRKHRNLSDKEIKEVMATQVERALKRESAE